VKRWEAKRGPVPVGVFAAMRPDKWINGDWINGINGRDKWGQSLFILWLEGCLLMTSGVHVLDVAWQQEENK